MPHFGRCFPLAALGLGLSRVAPAPVPYRYRLVVGGQATGTLDVNELVAAPAER